MSFNMSMFLVSAFAEPFPDKMVPVDECLFSEVNLDVLSHSSSFDTCTEIDDLNYIHSLASKEFICPTDIYKVNVPFSLKSLLLAPTQIPYSTPCWSFHC